MRFHSYSFFTLPNNTVSIPPSLLPWDLASGLGEMLKRVSYCKFSEDKCDGLLNVITLTVPYPILATVPTPISLHSHTHAYLILDYLI